MGCLNSNGQFKHWFGNIHLSGRCNRSCYFCIGQHMMALDRFDILDKFPLEGLDKFVQECNDRIVNEINVTGTNTDPLLYRHTKELKDYLCSRIPNLVFKIRTNAVKKDLSILSLYDGGSVTICSFDKEIYKRMMGAGSPPDVQRILDATNHWKDMKVNVVLGDENVLSGDIHNTLGILEQYGVRKVNLREPYGQPHIGNPLENLKQTGTILGNPAYKFGDMNVLYWDVHYTEVESVNLYANGIVSTTYPITKGHDPVSGTVKDQTHFKKGRNHDQWLSY